MFCLFFCQTKKTKTKQKTRKLLLYHPYSTSSTTTTTRTTTKMLHVPRVNTHHCLNNVKCPKHINIKKDKNCAIFLTRGNNDKIIFGSRNNFITHAANYYCGARASKQYNLLGHRHKMKLGEGDYIKLPFDIVIVGSIIITLELYLLLNTWTLEYPGDKPGNWRKRLITLHLTYQQNYATKSGKQENVSELKKAVNKHVISTHILTKIEQEIYLKNHIPNERIMDNILYRMGTKSIQSDHTYKSVKNVYSEWDADHPRVIINKQEDAAITRNLYKIAVGWWIAKNDTYFVLILKPVPREKYGEKHQHFVPELATITENYLQLSEKDIELIAFKGDGLQKNITIPLQVGNILLNKHGDYFNGYPLVPLCKYNLFFAADNWHRKRLLWSKNILTKGDIECINNNNNIYNFMISYFFCFFVCLLLLYYICIITKYT